MYVRIAPLWLAACLAAALLPGPADARAQAPEEAPGAESSCEPPPPVRVGRVWGRHNVEERRLVLTTCEGTPRPDALDALSVLARPRGTDPPTEEALGRARDRNPTGRLVAPGIPRLHPGLLVRLQAIANRFPGRRIEIVSGYRPRARRTSRHRHARALDIRVQGVSRAHVSELARTLPETGVGYYPNSTFTHVDVRERSAYWVDRSAPGQPADYGPSRRPGRRVEEERQEIVAKALSALEEEALGRTAPPDGPTSAPEESQPASAPAPEPTATEDGRGQAPHTGSGGGGIDWSPPDPWNEEPCETEEAPLTDEEIAALRRQWLDAVRSLASSP